MSNCLRRVIALPDPARSECQLGRKKAPKRHRVLQTSLVNRQFNARFKIKGQKNREITNRPITVHLLY
ncbi:hypothetical protein NDU88_000522 [Pleurodeles waltl]|uniref:Uncharacterized protein n=1 Tax=Pleurodeles waltl TaxID=8319 RepID=A0AAV7U479_PLEWA|nr:hypothetical protein NDU88_000522 [Pleurodeles waltl]